MLISQKPTALEHWEYIQKCLDLGIITTKPKLRAAVTEAVGHIVVSAQREELNYYPRNDLGFPMNPDTYGVTPAERLRRSRSYKS